ncbi:MAG: vitamin K epoxide reductase family protein [Chromatiaceae bacterium]
MRSRFVAVKYFLVLLLALVSCPGPAFAEDKAPAVRAVLFYGADCPQCRELFSYFLPGLFEQYGDRLQIAAIDVGTTDGGAIYREAATRYKLPPKWGGVPTIVAADKSMVGLIAISQTLGDGLDKVAGIPGAGSWPALAGLERLLPAAVAKLDARVARDAVLPAAIPAAGGGTRAMASDRDRVGNALAIAVLVGMGLALVHSLVRVVRDEGSPRRAPAWLLPAGLIGYGAILVTWLMGRKLAPRGGGWRWLPWAIALFGVLFSLRLTALEPFVIGATCLWCLGSAVSITITLWLLSAETRLRDESLTEARATTRR